VRSRGESDSGVTGARTGLPERDDCFITVEDFARIAHVSRRTIDRYRRNRATGFPTEYDMSRGKVPRPRFKLADVLAWMETRALW
jgi:predicted DNA-binding transcriptional regulator AlpA